jgi:hypothetical protein
MTALQLIRLLEAAPKDAEIVISWDKQFLPPKQIHFSKVSPIWSDDDNDVDPICYVLASQSNDPDPVSSVILYVEDA